MKFKAAVLNAVRTPLTIEEIDMGELGPTDVLVRIRASGLCHTDLEVIEGSLAYPLPIVLGHEGAGVVEAVGKDVTLVKLGEHVVCSWNPHCGHCFYCERRPADSVRAVLALPAQRPAARRPFAPVTKRRADASLLGGVLARAVLRGAGVRCHRRAGRHPLRPRLPDRVRRDDRRRGGHAQGAGRAGRQRAGDRLRGSGAERDPGAKLAGAGSIMAADLSASKRETAIRFGAHVAWMEARAMRSSN